MNTYIISKGKWRGYKDFIDLESAQNYAKSLGQGYTAKLAPPNKQLKKPTAAEQLEKDKEFSNSIIENLTLYNRESWPLDKVDAKTQQKKFDDFVKDLNRCDIKLSNIDLQNISIDNFLSQEKKTELTNLINVYLINQIAE